MNSPSTFDIATQLVALCRTGQHMRAVETLYSPDIVSVEPISFPGMPAVMKGITAVIGKNHWWEENHVIHSVSVEGPWPNGDRFIVRFVTDTTFKPTGERRKTDEMGLYRVEAGKIVYEEFFFVA